MKIVELNQKEVSIVAGGGGGVKEYLGYVLAAIFLTLWLNARDRNRNKDRDRDRDRGDDGYESGHGSPPNPEVMQ